MNKSSSPLLHLHLHLHLLHFFYNEQIFIFQKKNKKKKISKQALGLGALDSYFLGFFQKIFKIFNSLKKFKILQKKKNPNFQFLEKIQDFQIFQKKKKKSKFSIPSKNLSFSN